MTNGYLSNEKLELGNSQLPLKQPPIEEVDSLADELVSLYNNPDFRTWYCKVIYDFGIEQVREWQRKAEKADSPAKLFSYYVKQARAKQASSVSDNADIPTITDKDLTEEAIAEGLHEASRQLNLDTSTRDKRRGNPFEGLS